MVLNRWVTKLKEALESGGMTTIVSPAKGKVQAGMMTRKPIDLTST
jgi:hypothetical protein